MAEVWVKLVDSGMPDAPWCPDTGGRPFKCVAGIPTDKSQGKVGVLLSEYVLVTVSDADAEAMTKEKRTYEAGQVPKIARLMTGLIRECRGEYATKAEAFLSRQPIPSEADAVGRSAIAEAIVQAAARGLPKDEALKIAGRLGVVTASKA